MNPFCRHLCNLLTGVMALAFIACRDLTAQTPLEEAMLEVMLEEEAGSLLEHLEILRDNPIPINICAPLTLEALPFLTPHQVYSIIRERRENGPFRNWSDLLHRLFGMKDVLEMIKSYITFENSGDSGRKNIRMRFRAERTLEESVGFEKNRFQGSPWKCYQKVSFSYNRWQAGFIFEKDPGEKRLADHSAGFVEWEKKEKSLHVVLGCFQAGLGGLVFWMPYGFPKGADPVLPVTRHSRSIRGYTGTDEYRYLNGAAVEWEKPFMQFKAFISSKRVDASETGQGITSIDLSGLHRTGSESAKKNNLTESLLGGDIRFLMENGSMGLTAWTDLFSKPFSTGDNEEPFRFEGKQLTVLGCHGEYRTGRIYLISEAAISIPKNRGKALFSPESQAFILNGTYRFSVMTLAFSFRKTGAGFHNPYSQCFGSPDIRNETGLYWGLKVRAGRNTRMAFYTDSFFRPWKTRSIPVPERGNDYFFQFDQKWNSVASSIFRIRWLDRQKACEAKTALRGPLDIVRQNSQINIRIHSRFDLSSALLFQQRIECSFTHSPYISGTICHAHSEKGILTYQDLTVRPFSKFTVSLRWIVFGTDSYETRIYETEKELHGASSSLPLYLSGNRWYICLQWLTRSLRLSMKLGSTDYAVTPSASGLDSITKNTRTRIGFQTDLLF